MDPITEARKSKRTVTIILIITGLLAVASVITGYYFFQINDVSPQDSNASQGCACYYVATNSKIASCADASTKDAFEFQTGSVQSNDSCSVQCDLRLASALAVPDSTVIACKINDFPINPGCVDVSLEDENKKRYANDVPQGKDLTLKAKFRIPSNATADASFNFYESFSFLVNGAKTDVLADQAIVTGENNEKVYEVSTTVKDYSTVDALTIQAIGNSLTGSQITSDACNRVYAVSKPQAPTCTELKAEIVNEGTTPKVNEITISTASINDPDSLTIKFNVGTNSRTLTTKNLASTINNGNIVLSKSFLYATSNFTEGSSFSVLDEETGKISISAQVYVDSKLVTSDNCKGDFTIPAVVDETPREPTDNGNENPDPGDPDNEPNEPAEEPTDTQDTSNFSVDKASSVSCVERVAPSNTVRYTITISNEDSESEKVVRVEDKLPLGFDYIANSTIIDGSSQSDSGLVETQLVGSSQQVTFEKTGGWTIAAGGVLTIKFTASVGSDALTGTNLNEVVVVPENTPLSSTNVRTSASVIVSQSCTAPETGIFDSTVSKVVLAILIIFLGTFFYFSQSGITLAEKLVYSPVGTFIRNVNLKASNPKQYFEEKVVKDLEKKKKS